MDAKPQRPRALRVNDENMPPPALPGKTLHQRTKSTPSLSALFNPAAIKAGNKRILGEVNANVKILQPAKDDSEVGKASPGKISMQEPVKPVATAAFARPATRALAPKPISTQNVPLAMQSTFSKPTTTTQMTAAEPDPLRKVTAKKSTKVLRDAHASELPGLDVKPITSVAPIMASSRQPLPSEMLPQPAPEKPASSSMAIQHQEVHKTESVPLRDEPVARPQARASNAATTHVSQSLQSQDDALNYLNYQAAQQQVQMNVQAAYPMNGAYLPDPQPLAEQYFDVDEVDYEYEEGFTTARSFGLAAESTGGITTILGPKYTQKVNEELRIAKEFVEATRSPDDIEDEQWDTSMVAEYGDEIFEYMRDLECRLSANPRYMEQQTEIQWSMRAILIDWVVQVHQRFNLLPETLFLTVNYIDRFLSCKIVSLGKLQLVGATAIFVASKYEEVQCPTISEIIFMVDGGYTADELLKAERFMLSMLQFELGWPGPMSFLRRISKADDYDLETRTLAKYFLEVTIMDERFVGCKPSFLAAGAHCLARLMIYGGEWSKAHVYYSNYTWSQLRQLLTAMLECCEDPRGHHSAVYEKYTDKRYKRASHYVAGKMAGGFRLPIENPAAQPMTPMECINGMESLLR